MDDFSDLHGRIADALGRISFASERMPSPDDMAALYAALEAERAVSDDLRAQLSAGASGPEASGDAVARMAELEEDRVRLRKANDELRRSLAELRDAHADGAVDAHLINASLKAELEALAAMRRSDRTEIDAIVALLAPAMHSKGTEDA